MKERGGEGGIIAGLSASDIAEQAGDGSGTNMLEGIGDLLGVPMSGFHLSSGIFLTLAMILMQRGMMPQPINEIYQCLTTKSKFVPRCSASSV